MGPSGKKPSPSGLPSNLVAIRQLWSSTNSSRDEEKEKKRRGGIHQGKKNVDPGRTRAHPETLEGGGKARHRLESGKEEGLIACQKGRTGNSVERNTACITA